MNKEMGIAYCGLACCLCTVEEGCPGCRKEGCKDREWCKSFKCGGEKGLKGCWECKELESCDSVILQKSKVKAFALFIRQYGEDKLYECLERNEKQGIRYHKDGINGDYDGLESTDAVFALLLNGRKNEL